MATAPEVPLDSESPAVLTIGPAIALGIYGAWLHRGWAATTKAIGFAAAVGGALAGAWLGFHAAGGLVALVTTIVGATAVANLALLVSDISRERSARNRSPLAAPREDVQPHVVQERALA
ncbi:MAG: hypothetical protein ACRDLS_17815 [Solirubrobacteraceae bacterium]